MRCEPIIIGHSMGGFVTQKYLEKYSAVAAILLASVPTSGTFKFNIRVIRRHPLLWLKANLIMKLYPIVKNPIHAREWFFSDCISDEDLANHHSQLQDESFRCALDMLMLNLPKPQLIKTPIAVLGAENDAIFSVEEVQKTARAYGVEAKIFPNMAHNMMSEPDWKDVAEWIACWIESIPLETISSEVS